MEQNKTALIVGMAKSGIASARLLAKHGYRVMINDMKEKIDGINITVYATQDAVESDSFGNDYDENADYSADVWDGTSATAAELAAATDETNKVVNGPK